LGFMKRLRLVAVVCLMPSFGLAVVEGCGGDNAASDAGPDATQPDVSAGDSAPPGNDAASDATPNGDGAAGCPTYSGTSEFCKAIVTHCGACGNKNITACERANFTSFCDKVATAFSATFASAETTCATDCNTQAACIKGELAEAGLSTAQQKAATDYCTACSDAGSACVAQVAAQLSLAEYSDTLVNAFDTTCTPDASAGCGNAYAICVTKVYDQMTAGVCSDASAD